MHEAALAMRQRIYHGDHPDIATDLSNLALCLDALGRTKEALPKFEEALAMSQRVHPGEHPSVAYGLANLGSCLDDLGRPEEAYQKYQEATKMLQDLLEKMPQSVAVKVQLAETQQKTGDVLREMGKETEALERYRTGLQIVESLLSAQVSSAQAIELRLSLRAKLHLEKAEVVVSQIMASGQAERLGLRKGDIIVRYNQRPIATSDELKRLTTRVKGSRIELEIRRGDQTLQPVASEGPLGLLCEDRSITNKM
jgi:tetratricopeptide (TPR) repeat protein